MKKILLSISVLALFGSGVKAQAPSYNMESWSNVQFSTTQQDPVGWASFNVLVGAGMQQTVFKETTSPYEGAASAKIVTQQISGVPVPGYDTVGLLILGKVQVFPSQKITYGVNYTGRPATVTFATKYQPSTKQYPVDTGWVLVQLTKWNSAFNKADTIASKKFTTSATNLAWTLQTIDLSSAYTQAISPDTLKIYCSSSSLTHPNIGSALWVDAFEFSGWVSTNDIDEVKNFVTTYPNPATNNVSVKCSVDSKLVEVMDITGRKIGSYLMKDNAVTIETLGFVPGLYIYNVIDEKNKILNRGKFEVTK